jgi:hypothetical protein
MEGLINPSKSFYSNCQQSQLNIWGIWGDRWSLVL